MSANTGILNPLDEDQKKGEVPTPEPTLEKNHHTENTAHSSERCLALSQLPFPLLLVQPSGKIEEASAQACQLLQYQKAELVELNWNSLTPEADHQGLKILLEDAFRAEHDQPKEFRFETTFSTQNGKEIPMEVIATAMDVEEIKLIACYLVNLSEKKHMERQLFQSQKMEAVGQLARGVAHDFNNFLQVILGHTHLSLMDVPEDSSLHSDLRNISAAASKASQLVSQLQTMGRKHSLQPAVYDLKQSMRDLLSILQRVLGDSIELTLEINESTGIVYADIVSIEQVIINLAINARDAMPSGGHVTISLQPFLADRLFCESNDWAGIGRYIHLSFSDDGPGIPEDVLERIFEPFFTTKPADQGSGIGLAMAYGILRQHKGAILANSTVGKGTTFEIFLPTTDQPLTQEEVAFPKEQPTVAGTILFAEDNEDVLQISTRILEEQGYHVLSAHNGAEAIRLFDNNIETIDLVVLDVFMPEKNGDEVLSHIRSHRPGLPTILTTGHGTQVLPNLNTSQIEVDWMKKPFGRSLLLSKVERGLAR